MCAPNYTYMRCGLLYAAKRLFAAVSEKFTESFQSIADGFCGPNILYPVRVYVLSFFFALYVCIRTNDDRNRYRGLF